ncbi:MAG: tryptophan halogenase family protein [Betaproteobacteria bacterium]
MNPAISVIANGAVGAAIAGALEAAGLTPRKLDAVPSEWIAGDLTIIALECATFGRLLELGRRLLALGQSALFVTCEGDSVVAGPVMVPRVSACFECRIRHGLDGNPEPAEQLARLAPVKTGGVADLAAGVLDATAQFVADAARELTRVDPERQMFTSAAILSRSARRHVTILPSGWCDSCPDGLERDGVIPRTALAEVAAALELEGFQAELAYSPGPALHPDRYRKVVIVGGGTAGYLAALFLRTRIPDLEVTLIESSKIPIISVGEATTPEMVRFLHAPALLGVDIVDFHRQVMPAFKLGIQFVWGEGTEGTFHYPFQYAPLGDPMVHEGRLDSQSVASLLMSADKAPFIDGGNGSVHSLLETVRFAYHLDNVRFVRFLQEEAERRGIRHIDTTIRTAVVTANGGEIDHLVTENGEVLRFDLYVDASGFRSILMEGALKSPFVSFAPSLFTDCAIVADEPHGGIVKPYTRAQALACGWCWTISFEGSDHIGYVYSSAFSSEEEALAEMRRAHPRMGPHRQVQFRSGRHEHFMQGNVVAIGNSYAFVEPLESTALHMVIHELQYLTNHFPLKTDVATKNRLNRKMNDMWDQLRWFLAIHYRFNRGLDTEFWRAARATADISGAEQRIALFRERAPLSDRPSLFYSVIPPDFFSGDHAFDTLLLGQRVPGRLGPARQSPAGWAGRAALRRKVVERALTQAQSLPLLRERESRLLRRFVESPTSWVHHWIAR